VNRIVPIMLGVLFAVLLALAVWLFAGLPSLGAFGGLFDYFAPYFSVFR
jgi:hypothetical protein